MTFSLKKVVNYMQRPASSQGVVVPMTHHDAIVQFWIRVVVSTCIAFVVVTGLSLSVWWVTPRDQSTQEVLLPDEELPEQTSDGYDVTKAEKTILFFQERQKKIPAI